MFMCRRTVSLPSRVSIDDGDAFKLIILLPRDRRNVIRSSGLGMNFFPAFALLRFGVNIRVPRQVLFYNKNKA